MSTKYKSFNEVPVDVIANRLEELSDCFNDKSKFEREFTRRIPAELDRDPDLVMSRASQILLDQEKRIAELERDIIEAHSYVHMTLNGDETFSEVDERSNRLLRKFALEQQAKGACDIASQTLDDLKIPKMSALRAECFKAGVISMTRLIDEKAEQLRQQARELKG